MISKGVLCFRSLVANSALLSRVFHPQGRRGQLLPCLFALGMLMVVSIGPWPEGGSRAQAGEQREGRIDFVRDVQPILQASCYTCHSGTQPKGQLRLDVKVLALKGGISGPVIIPGDSRSSRLIHRVSGLGVEERMPLKGEPLTPPQISVLRQWIDQGVPWPALVEDEKAKEAKIPTHWAYVKPLRPAVPAVRHSAWVRNPVDNFILARLEKEGLTPAPEASKETLVRRLSLDLTGLPPSVKDVDEFVAGRSPDAYEKLVDRLLASPHYGERWARPWLDLARYADTNGYEKDLRRSIWKYRDWVINALNEDMPFDRFTIEQIAGDMLPGATLEQKIATGFHRNTMFNEEGGVDKEEARWENLIDRVNTTATLWLGTTLACAQCHNHKYDPFTQKEYYQFLAFFDNMELTVRLYGDTSQKYIEPQLDLPTPEQEARRKKILAEIDELEQRLKAETTELAAEQLAWERSILSAASDWSTLAAMHFTSAGGTTLTKTGAGSILAGGANPSSDLYLIEARTKLKDITGIRLEALPSPGLPRGGPGRDPYGNFFLSDFQVEAASTQAPQNAQKITFRNVVADDGTIEDKKFKQLWSIDASREDKRLSRQIVFVADTPFGAGEETSLRIAIQQNSEFGGQGLGHFRLSVTTAGDPSTIVGISAKLRPLLEIPATGRTEEQRKVLAEFFRTVAPSLKPVRKRVAELRKEVEELGIVSTLVVQESQSFERPSAHLRLRGSFLSKGQKVYAGVPAALHPLPESELPNRLGLARWLVSRENPLVARVTVNRIWEQYFGQGIVETSEDFGAQGERPTHPELLDWLATGLIEKNWSLKAIHRLIVTSATYRQSSKVTAALLEWDPYNRFLARGPRFRMEAEMIRDLALVASGLLSRKIGGPSVFPPQPEGIWDLPYNDDRWVESQGEDRYRRGLYTFIRRTAPYPSLLAFDAPSREVCTVRRIRTNTPLQALTSLNDPAFFEAAQGLARRIVAEAGPDAPSRAVYGFRLCVARKPAQEEIEKIIGWFEREREFFQKNPGNAQKLLGPAGAPAPASEAELAAWAMVSNVLLNLDETLTKE